MFFCLLLSAAGATIKCYLSGVCSTIWAACCLGFFGFLRVGEFTVPSLEEYDETTHLSLADIALDSYSAPTLLRVHIKASKTDPFWKGVDLFLGRTFSQICPVKAMTAFLLERGLLPAHCSHFRMVPHSLVPTWWLRRDPV